LWMSLLCHGIQSNQSALNNQVCFEKMIVVIA
jgi:hypothetical protein